jgi:hypothetical protein
MAFRILSLDGGGARSLVQILTLMDLYRSGGQLLTGHTVLADFDLVVANSGGALVLGGLIKDLRLADIRDFFRPEPLGRTLFARDPRSDRRLARFGRRLTGSAPRYATQAKLDGLRALLNGEAGEPGIGDVTLDGLHTRLRGSTRFIITAFDEERRREILFRSDPDSAAACFGIPAVATLAEAIHASTTPDGIFDAPAEVSRGLRCRDAAVAGTHNPLLTGLAEALAGGVDPAEIEILSIGTGNVVLPFATGGEDATGRKLVKQRRIPNSAGGRLVDDPSDRHCLLTHFALRQAVPSDPGDPVTTGSFVRLNPLVQPVRSGDRWLRPAGLAEGDGDADEFVSLRRLPSYGADARDLALLEKFCALWHCDAVVNQPIRANTDTLACEIGNSRYSEAKARWLARVAAQPVANGPQSSVLGQNFAGQSYASSIAGAEVTRQASAPRFAASRTG